MRRATASDAPAIRRIAHDGWWAAYRGLLLDETIEWFLERAYSEERVDLRIERHETWVALADEAVGLFAETVIEPDRVTLVAIYADPALRGLGLGTAALSTITAAHPDLPSSPTSWSATRRASRSTLPAASCPASPSTNSSARSWSANAAGGSAILPTDAVPAFATSEHFCSEGARMALGHLLGHGWFTPAMVSAGARFARTSIQ